MKITKTVIDRKCLEFDIKDLMSAVKDHFADRDFFIPDEYEVKLTVSQMIVTYEFQREDAKEDRPNET